MESATQNSNVDARSTDGAPVDPQERPVEATVQSWLEWQCGMFKGVLHTSLFSAPQVNSVQPTRSEVSGSTDSLSNTRIGSWPDNSIQPGLVLPVASQAFQENKPVCRSLSLTGKQKPKSSLAKSLLCLAVPLRVGSSEYVLVMVLTDRTAADRASIVQLVRWGGRWLPLANEANQSPVSVNQRISTTVIAQSSFYSQCMSLVLQLTEEMSCDRVSLGWLSGSEINVVAISGVSVIDQRMQAVKDILVAMKECSDQKVSVQSTRNITDVINREHIRLAMSRSGGCCSIPMFDGERCVGVLLLEKHTKEPFYTSTVNWCHRLLSDITPSLLLQSEAESSVARKGFTRVNQLISRMIPGKFSRVRFLTASVLFVILCASLIEGTYTVTAAATIEGRDKQVIVAPYDGFVLTASARSGESVESGQQLAALDDRGLTVERDRWSSELSKMEKSYNHALASGDRLELRLLQSRRQEIQAEQALIDQKIQRAQLVAPFPGVIVKGDLSQKLGAPVEAGQVLYEVASVDQYRLLLDVDEHQIARIAENKLARLRLNALPGEVHSIRLSGMLPIARVVDGRNVFRYEANFVDSVENLRPGMQGYARLEAGEQSLLWIWTEGLAHRLRVLFWSLGF